MGYLERLKALDASTLNSDLPSKPSKVPFEGFEGCSWLGDPQNLATENGDEAERAAIIEFDGGIPREWAECLARVLSSPPPRGIAALVWEGMIERAAMFCDRWAAIAYAEGWTAGELFGLNLTDPYGDPDARSGAFISHDLEVIEITREAVVCRTSEGAIQRRGRRSGLASPVWEHLRG